MLLYRRNGSLKTAGDKGVKLERKAHDDDYHANQLEYFHSEYPWIDRYRAFFMLDTSEISYTEMSLNNIAYCSCKLKNFSAARDSYKKLAKLYPKSELAKIGFQNLENSEQYQSELAVAETSSEQDIPVSAENTSNNCAPSFSKYDN